MEKKIVFSENFVWGAATSAYQIEGAVKEEILSVRSFFDGMWDR